MYVSVWIIVAVVIVLLFIMLYIKSLNKDIRSEKEKRSKAEAENRELSYEVKATKTKLEEENKTQIREITREFTNEINVIKSENTNLETKVKSYQERELTRNQMLEDIFESNLKAFPYLAGIMADYKTAELLKLEKQLDWGHNEARIKKVQDIRVIRKEARDAIEKAKEAEYQLAYLLQLYPELEDIIETDYKELDLEVKTEIPEHDPARDYLSKEEWKELNESERNQLALDRYIASHRKTNWQIGRDYEAYVGYIYETQGAKVEYTGSILKLQDLGRDLIIHMDNQVRIVQCKYWSKDKLIHEKHIFQLYGTVISYCMENNITEDSVKGILITNICLSDTAKKMAKRLGILFKENYPIGDYPRIKCNVGRDDQGNKTYIYHLPMDLQYDSVVIKKQDECYAFTVKEAEVKGFRRAYKWRGI